MKKITESAVFREVSSSKTVKDGLKNIQINRDQISPDKFEEALTIIQRKMNFSTKGKTLNHLAKGDIVLVSNPLYPLPKFLNTVGKANNGKIVAVIDVTHFARLNKTTEQYEIYPKTLFNLMQNGTILVEVMNNWNKYTHNISIIKSGAIIYSKLVGKVMDKLFAININPFKQDSVHFFLAKFFLINMCGKANNETADNIAYNACFNRSTLSLIKEEEKVFSDTAYDSIFNLFHEMSKLNGMKDLNTRTFIENWARMYGESTLLALDYLPAFLSMIFGSIINGNVAKDYIVENVAGKFISPMFTEFSKLLK